MKYERVYELDLGSIEKVKLFEERIADCSGCFRLEQNGRMIDAKDIISLFMMDLRRPVRLHVLADSLASVIRMTV